MSGELQAAISDYSTTIELNTVVANRAVELALIRADVTSGAIGFRQLSIQLEGTIEVGNRTRKVSLRRSSDTPVKKALLEPRRDPNRPVQVPKGGLECLLSDRARRRAH